MKKHAIWACFAILTGLTANGVSAAPVILDGDLAAFPDSPVLLTSSVLTGSTARDVKSSRQFTQTFQVSSDFKLDAIYIGYRGTGTTLSDGTLTLRIFPVADVNAAGPVVNGTDILNVPVTFNATVRSEANFQTTVANWVAKFDLTGTDEVNLAATTGTAGYGVQFVSSSASNPLFGALRYVGGNPYASGKAYDPSFQTNSTFNNSDWSIALTSSVPEPATLSLLGAGALGLGLRRRRS